MPTGSSPASRSASPRLSEDAPAKVNLALHIEGRRPDGYHSLDTLVVFTEAGDVLKAVRNGAGPEPRLVPRFVPRLVPRLVSRLELGGPFGAGLAGHDNLVLRAAALLEAAAPRGSAATFSFWLEKRLPVASGIGGGSADAAAALRLLNRLLDLNIGAPRLAEIGAPLGADVPMCVYSRSLRATGRGENIAPTPGLPKLHLVLANPGVSLATPDVFAAREGAFGQGLGEMPKNLSGAGELSAWLGTLRNDLQDAACRLAPPVKRTLEAVAAQPGCRLSRMSGSGATVFGLFDDAGSAEAAAAALSRAQPSWWVVATRTL